MPRYFLHISYKGTAYHGWQVQPNGITVQGKLEEAILQVTSMTEVKTMGCGRTDTGVHASQFYVHVDMDGTQDLTDMVYQLNSVLPHDIAILEILEVKEDAHARFDASMREYMYFIHHSKDPFVEDRSLFVRKSLNVELMNKASERLLGEKDFACFAKTHSNSKTTICDISLAHWIHHGNTTSFTIRANRFLRNMVRSIVGTMMQVGHESISLDDFDRILASGQRSEAGSSAAAHGLFLTRVEYPYLNKVWPQA